MFEVRVETTFEAGHRRGPDGEETPLHHHEWRVAARARSDELDRIGLVIDFRVLRAEIDAVVGELDQRVLEDLEPFGAQAPTPAAVARWIFERLDERLTARVAGGDEDGGCASPSFWLRAIEIEADPGVRFEYGGRR